MHKMKNERVIFILLSNKNNNDMLIVFSGGYVLGAIIFILIYGFRVLDCSYDAWLMQGGDLYQHYLGWLFFRESPWTFPLGLVEGLIYPEKVSVVYMDSIPIFALIFKALSPLLPQHFQYFGIWGIMCFALQGGIAAIIIRKFADSNIISILISMFFIISPIMIQRMFGHTSLAAHWIILVAIAFFVYKQYFSKTLLRNVLCWSLLMILAVCVHIYFLPMVFLLMIGYLVEYYWMSKKVLNTITVFSSSIFFTLLVMWSLGYFYGNASLAEGGLGYYSANANAFLNSQNWSQFLLPLSLATEGQYEGFAYLGLGIIMLGFLVLSCHLNNFSFTETINEFTNSRTAKAVFLIICIFLLISLSPSVTIGSYKLFTIPYPTFLIEILSIFRASGRFLWPVFYIIVVFVF